MTSPSNLDELSQLNGIIDCYHDLNGVEQRTSQDTKLSLLEANGLQIDNDAMICEALNAIKSERAERILPTRVIATTGKPLIQDMSKSFGWSVLIEGEQDTVFEGRAENQLSIPALPSGIHTLLVRSGNRRETAQLIVAPERAPTVLERAGQEKLWGVNLALYGLHQEGEPGIGNYRHLAEAASALQSRGAGFVGINPVHAMGWQAPDIISPYSPSHRGLLNTNHISVEQVEPRSERTANLIVAWKQTVANVAQSIVDYEQHAKFHRPILQSMFDDFKTLATESQQRAFADYSEHNVAARAFANFERLSQTHGSDWRQWPDDIREPGEVPELLDDDATFHLWMQWQAEMQVEDAQRWAQMSGMGLGLYLDLAVGSRRDGAEAWMERDAIAGGVSIGAPPDHLSPAGQNWNLAAYSPRKLADSGFRAFRDVVARNLKRCGVLRIDHVLGLYRNFWIPDNGAPGGYIRQDLDALLAIIRLESERHGTVVIGEDLGLVPDGLRTALATSGIYSYSVLQYEKDQHGKFVKPSDLRPQSLACFGTHDTPTLKGFSAGEDIAWWSKLGWIDKEQQAQAKVDRASEIQALKGLCEKSAGKGSCDLGSDFDALSHSVHGALAGSPVAMISVQLDDMEANIDAQNLPGTIDEHPNWRRRTKSSLDEIPEHPGVTVISNIMAANGRQGRKSAQEEGSF